MCRVGERKTDNDEKKTFLVASQVGFEEFSLNLFLYKSILIKRLLVEFGVVFY